MRVFSLSSQTISEKNKQHQRATRRNPKAQVDKPDLLYALSSSWKPDVCDQMMKT
jgi:ribonuclease I